MSSQKGSSQKSRTSRKSAGERKSSKKVRLTHLEKRLIAGFRGFKAIGDQSNGRSGAPKRRPRDD